MPDAPSPRHATPEQLSAYLDGRAETDEATFLDGHLPTCARCADELAGLTAVRDLLRLLPVVEPPLSFALPVTVPVDPRAPVRIDRYRRLATITRAMAAVAAVFFVLFFTADMAGLGEDRPLPVTGALSSDSLTSSAPAPAPPAAPREPAAARPAAAKPAASPAAAIPRAEPRPVDQAARADQPPALPVGTVAPTAPAAYSAPAAAEAAPPSGGGASVPGQAVGAGQAPASTAGAGNSASGPAPTRASVAGGAGAGPTVALPTPVFRPPSRSAGETPTGESVAAGDAARQSDARDQTGGRSGDGRTRLGMMANRVHQLAGTPSPIRWSWIGTGLLAVILLVGAVVVGQRHGR